MLRVFNQVTTKIVADSGKKRNEPASEKGLSKTFASPSTQEKTKDGCENVLKTSRLILGVNLDVVMYLCFCKIQVQLFFYIKGGTTWDIYHHRSALETKQKKQTIIVRYWHAGCAMGCVHLRENLNF